MKKWCVNYYKYCEERRQDIMFSVNIEAISEADANKRAKELNLRYFKVMGEVVLEIDSKGTKTDHDIINNN